jgi:leader peptidase (prepilin peptidase) / N-methyltransferase
VRRGCKFQSTVARMRLIVRAMEWAVCIGAIVVCATFGWLAPGFQHLLYRQPEYRDNPASGRKLLIMRAWMAAACGAVGGIAFRPDHYDFGPALLTAAFALVLLVLASTDFEHRIIPNNLSYPAIGAAAALCWAWPDRDVTDIFLGLGFAVGIAAVLFVFGEVFGRLLGVSATPFGLGDVKLILLIGLLLGWPVVMSALFIGVIIAGVPAIALMLSGRSRGVFAYGPYLALGALAGLLWFDRFD